MPKTTKQRKLKTAQLDRLHVLLTAKPLTAKEISTALKCCLPTAYVRVRELVEQGADVYEVDARSKGKQPGPYAVAFGVNP